MRTNGLELELEFEFDVVEMDLDVNSFVDVMEESALMKCCVAGSSQCSAKASLRWSLSVQGNATSTIGFDQR